MKLIGVTGGIGSGKSTVCQVFSLLGVPVYSADIRAKALMNSLPELQHSLQALLGDDIVCDNQINRPLMASRIFADSRLLRQVNEQIHPAVLEDFRLWASRQHAPYVLHEAAILFESGFESSMHQNIVVTAPLEVRIARVMNRDNLTRDQVEQRMSHQWPEEELICRADHILVNDNTRMVLPQILELHDKLNHNSYES